MFLVCLEISNYPLKVYFTNQSELGCHLGRCVSRNLPPYRTAAPGWKGEVPRHRHSHVLKVPGARGQVPGARCQVPGARLPGARGQKPSARCYWPGARCQVPGARSQVQGAIGHVPGARCHWRGARCQVPAAIGQVPCGTIWYCPGTRCQRPGVMRKVQGDRCHVHGIRHSQVLGPWTQQSFRMLQTHRYVSMQNFTDVKKHRKIAKSCPENISSVVKVSSSSH